MVVIYYNLERDNDKVLNFIKATRLTLKFASLSFKCRTLTLWNQLSD